MTDLISKLADYILALINAQPRSPTKAEIMEVLKSVPEIAHPLLFARSDEKTAKAWVFEITACDILNSGEAGTEKNRENGGLSSLWGNQDRAKPHPEATQAARETYAYLADDRSAVFDVQAFDERCRQGLERAARIQRCPAHAGGEHAYKMHPTKLVCACGATKP